MTMGTTHTENIGPQYNWPVHLEMLYTSKSRDLLPTIPSLAFEQEMERVLSGPNHHLRGVALRIRALQAQEKGGSHEQVLSPSSWRAKKLLLTGDPVELAKTRAEMARVKLAQQDRPMARNYAFMAWEGLSGCQSGLLSRRPGAPAPGRNAPRPGPRKQDLIDRFMDLMDGFIPSADVDEILNRLVASTSRFFGAERGGLFWFSGGAGRAGGPNLRASYNLDKAEASSEGFRSSFGHILKSFRSGEPLILEGSAARPGGPGRGPVAVLLPITLRGAVRGVLYLDNSYIEDGSQDIDRDVVVRMSKLLSTSIERIYHYAEIIEADRSKAATMGSEGPGEEARIIGRSPPHDLAPRPGGPGGPVRRHGAHHRRDRGGRELLARRIHDSSRRKEGPFVVVTLASIPETLVESELFGHEKGAFTGADRQKPGGRARPHRHALHRRDRRRAPSAQVKLLRVIQEKSCAGGGHPDERLGLRLVAATNRDPPGDRLGQVQAGILFFRLNVIPLTMPCLRDRGDDVIELAREFLRHYSRKYHRVLPSLSQEDIRALKAYRWPGNVRELEKRDGTRGHPLHQGKAPAQPAACLRQPCLEGPSVCGHPPWTRCSAGTSCTSSSSPGAASADPAAPRRSWE